MEFYIFKQFIKRLINEIFYYSRIILRKFKIILKVLVLVFIAVLIFYFCTKGGSSWIQICLVVLLILSMQFSVGSISINLEKNIQSILTQSGLLVFCGGQGSGKTLSAVQYVKKLCEQYPRAILVTNVKIERFTRTHCCR